MDDTAYRKARQRVIGRLILQITFVANLLFFLLITLAILATSHGSAALIGALVWALIWGTFLAIHAVFAFNLFSRRIDQAVQRELERERPKEKAKHQVMEIGDDGELVDIREEAPATQHSSKTT